MGAIELRRYIRNLIHMKEFVIALVFYFSFFQLPFKDADFVVSYKDVSYKIPKELKALIGRSELDGVSKSIIKEFSDGDTLRVIVLRNNSSVPVRNIEMTVLGVSKFSGVYVESSSYRMATKLDDYAKFDRVSGGKIFFKNISEIAPYSSLMLGIYGGFDRFVMGEYVQVVSSAESMDVIRERDVSGIPLFVADFLPEIFVVLMVVLFVVGAKRFSARKDA